jgi:hypothetical protein
VTESRSKERLNGPTSSFLLKSSFLVKIKIGVVKEEMPEQLMHGFIKITLLTKPAHHTKHMVGIMAWVAQQSSNAKTVSHKRDVGLKKELKFTVLKSMETLLVNKIL